MIQRTLKFLRGNVAEFWEFAFKGNLISLAIGVVLGGAFGSLVKSFVDNLVVPLLGLLTGAGKDGAYTQWQWRGIKYGAFLGDAVSFLLVSLAIFLLMIKVVDVIVKLTHRVKPPPAPGEPAEKECPLCLMKIPNKARRCGHCTADLPAATPVG
jgi:large conductance mechanosensitive channel